MAIIESFLFDCCGSLLINHNVYLGDGQTFVVSWTTIDPTEDSQVDYGTSPSHLNETFKGSQERFVDGGSLAREEYIHKAIYPRLPPNQQICTYSYCDIFASRRTYFNLSSIINPTAGVPNEKFRNILGTVGKNALFTLDLKSKLII